jgi:hypothetical protein
VVSSTVPRPVGDLEREFVSPFSGDISDLCSAGRSLASDHQQWALAGDGRSGRHFPPPSGGPPIYNNNSLNGRRKSCTRFCTLQTGLTDPNPIATDAGSKRCRIPDCTYNAYYDVSEQEQTEYCGQGHQL